MKYLKMMICAVLVLAMIAAAAGCGQTESQTPAAEESKTEAESAQTAESPEETETAQAEEYRYLLMNIPYADFYAAELEGNQVEVDSVSSATLNKTRSGGMMSGGSYHENADGSDISGIIFPVMVEADADLSAYRQLQDADSVTISVTNRGNTTETVYSGAEALFESSSYSYYELTETPAYYKVLTVENGKLSFGKVEGMEESAPSGITASLNTNSSYGDYQLNLEGLNLEEQEPTIYAVILHTAEGVDYGLRHLENIWRYTQLAWCSGFTAQVHGCDTSSAHYESMMGKTITGVTYYTNQGKLEISLDQALYIPLKFEHSLTVQDAPADGGSASVEMAGFPEDYKSVFHVSGRSGAAVEGFTCSGSALTWSGTPAPGSYTLTVNDENGVYSDYSASFILSTDVPAAAFNADSNGLCAASRVSDENFAAYLAGISTVSVDGQEYRTQGKGAVELVSPEDGLLDLTAEPFTAPAQNADGSYAVVVSALGYPDLSFTVTVPAAN